MINPATKRQLFGPSGVAVLVLLILVIYGFEAHARRRLVATPASHGDQGAYLAYARKMYETGYAVVGDRNRMPVFPFLLSLLYRPGLSEAEFLRRAQTFNVNLSIFLLGLLFLLFRKFLPAFYAAGLLAATAFGVFLYRAINAQAEVLYYFISFCGFILLLRMLIAPRWWLAILTGATVGLAHLTKASVLPGFAAWVAVVLAQIVWDFLSSRSTRGTSPWQRLGLLFLASATFVAVVFPYIRTSKQIYGQYFYNVNSAFVMWCDSSTEGWQFVTAHAQNDNWRGLPAEQVPSPSKYWREHSPYQIASRLVRGLQGVATQNAMAIGYYKFTFLLTLTAAFLWIRHWRSAGELIRARLFPAAFCFLFFFGYVLLYAWYDMIVRDTRFILSIFLPFVFSGSVWLLALERDRTVAIAGRRLLFAQLFPGILISLALIDVIYNAARACRLIA